MSDRCPYHTEPTDADIRIEWTYRPLVRPESPGDPITHAETPVTVVDTVCNAHYPMHKASLRAAETVRPVSVRWITR